MSMVGGVGRHVSDGGDVMRGAARCHPTAA